IVPQRGVDEPEHVVRLRVSGIDPDRHVQLFECDVHLAALVITGAEVGVQLRPDLRVRELCWRRRAGRLGLGSRLLAAAAGQKQQGEPEAADIEHDARTHDRYRLGRYYGKDTILAPTVHVIHLTYVL